MVGQTRLTPHSSLGMTPPSIIAIEELRSPATMSGGCKAFHRANCSRSRVAYGANGEQNSHPRTVNPAVEVASETLGPGAAIHSACVPIQFGSGDPVDAQSHAPESQRRSPFWMPVKGRLGPQASGCQSRDRRGQ